jgi:two-component system, NarL family, response regulator DesR
VVIVPTAARAEVRRALRTGADGVVKDADVDAALALTVQDVAAGQLVVPRGLRGEIDRRPLSHREKQVLGLAVLGATNAEIAQRLWVTEHTVKSHLSSSFSKLGVSSRHEAAELVLDQSDSLGAGVLAATRAGLTRRPATARPVA